MANREVLKVLKDSSGNALSGVAKTSSFNSDKVRVPPGFDRVGLILDIGTVTGTSPVMAPKVQLSINGGVTWLDTFPGADNAETQASLANVTGTKETSEFWPLRIPSIASSSSIVPYVRFVFTITGTSPSFTFTNAWYAFTKGA